MKDAHVHRQLHSSAVTIIRYRSPIRYEMSIRPKADPEGFGGFFWFFLSEHLFDLIFIDFKSKRYSDKTLFTGDIIDIHSPG